MALEAADGGTGILAGNTVNGDVLVGHVGEAALDFHDETRIEIGLLHRRWGSSFDSAWRQGLDGNDRTTGCGDDLGFGAADGGGDRILTAGIDVHDRALGGHGGGDASVEGQRCQKLGGHEAVCLHAHGLLEDGNRSFGARSDHAVGFALSEVLELHDKSSVEVYAYYIGDARTNDATQNRMKAVIDVWRDVTAMSDLEAAKLIMADEIDVLIDVNGYTKLARTKIFSYRPAPVIVNFCGYPGTMASPVHQYIIADEQIIPPGNELYYTEKVLHIPCNQPVDRKRLIGPRPTRTEAGLPEDAFVFACFNGMQKITAGVFTRWMAILTATPGSVLWLLGGSDVVNQRLRELATSAGVDPARIYFAPKAANPNHLARIAIADLFLDTFPYGAHSTASDALTMGLPVLTVPGKSFASRFCSSIVKSAGVPELICASPDEYVRKAVALARDPAALAQIRNSIQAQRETCALRDIPRLVRRLEELYWQMQGERERGETPVPDLSNMEMYYEIGTDVVLAEVEFEDEAAYRKRYQDRIADWHAFHPVPHDTRLWPAKPA